jgi:hypothetical protein
MLTCQIQRVPVRGRMASCPKRRFGDGGGRVCDGDWEGGNENQMTLQKSCRRVLDEK